MISENLLRDLIAEALRKNEAYLDKRFRVGDGHKFHTQFHFVRLLRFQPELADLDSADVADLVESTLQSMFPNLRADDPWEVFTKGAKHGSRDAFIKYWRKVERPVFQNDVLAEAARRSDEEGELVTSVTEKLRPHRKTLKRFVSIACHLDDILGGGAVIALPIERLGVILGVSRQRVGVLRQNAVDLGIIEEVLTYCKSGTSRFLEIWRFQGREGQAASYRLLTDYWKARSPES